jgi:hypothetical protein
MAYPSWLNRGMLNEQVQTAQQLCNGAGLYRPTDFHQPFGGHPCPYR